MRIGSPALCLLLLLAASAGAQDAGDPPVRFEHLALPLPHPEVQALAQGADGMLWIGTADGLARFDGLRLVTLRATPRDSTTLPSSNVRSLLVASDGALWVGTTRGPARLDARTDRFRRWPLPAGCRGETVGLGEDAAGRIVFGSRSTALCRLDPVGGAVETVPLPWAARPWGIEGRPDGSVWVLSPPLASVRACRIAPGGGPCRAVDTGPLAPRILGAAADGRLLGFGALDGRPPDAAALAEWEGGRFAPRLNGLPWFGFDEAPPLVGVGEGVWVGTATAGILALDPAAGTSRWFAPTPGDPASLPAHRVRALLVDRQGTVWVGTARGLARWRPPIRPFTVYRRFTGRTGEISDDRVNGLAEGRDGALWVTTNDGLNRLDPATGRFETFRVPPSQAAGPPAWAPASADPYRDAWWQVLEGADATLWVGGKRTGLFRLDRRTGRFLREVGAARALGLVGSDGVPVGFGVRHVFEDRSGRLWVGTTGEGLAVRQPDGDWDAVRPGTAGLPHPNVNRFHEDARGQVWVGTDAGLARLEPGPTPGQYVFEPVPLGTDEEAPVWSIAGSPAQPAVLWVGTVGAGLVRYDVASGGVRRFATGDGMPSDLVYGVLPDDEGRIWASTSRGLARITPQTGSIVVYDEDQGLQGDAFDLMAFHRSPTTGELWFGGPNGLSRLDPSASAVSGYRPPVVFTGVRVRDRERPGRPLSGDTLRLGPDENFLTVGFAALDFTDPHELRYRYRLSGVDDGWRVTTGERPEATYTALPPGTYRLDVLGANVDGVFGDTPARLTIVVDPAWWQRGGVRAGALLALVGLAGLAVVGVVRRAVQPLRDRQRAVADDLHAGPAHSLGHVGAGLARLEGGATDALQEVRARVAEVEGGIHEALLRLHPSAVGRLGVRRALDATVRRYRRAAPHVAIHTDWQGAGDGLPDDRQQALVEAATALLGHTLRVTGAQTVEVSLVDTEGGVGLRISHDGTVSVRSPALRDRLRQRRSGLVRAASAVRRVGGSLAVEDGQVRVDMPTSGRAGG